VPLNQQISSGSSLGRRGPCSPTAGLVAIWTSRCGQPASGRRRGRRPTGSPSTRRSSRAGAKGTERHLRVARNRPMDDSQGPRCYQSGADPERVQHHLTPPAQPRHQRRPGARSSSSTPSASPTIASDLQTFDATMGLPNPGHSPQITPAGSPPPFRRQRRQTSSAGRSRRTARRRVGRTLTATRCEYRASPWRRATNDFRHP